ncbi:hypothetical protein [Corallococcus carmarthensis]|uniref:Uncharacterized protein n=1 Tax=Corallococcus carmarthensis TaxID=2316728 RepID=A0A3A8K159_9BACT|nr:hypothetical protein [Corallococcus carmarthensis]NOK22952.1 hypothetical protein [Corallococcus carmarthensis]RKG96241.1 hypothetical protein D7X32_36690 [Corallococcus carmarthensis]
MYENMKGKSPAASMALTSSSKTKFDEFLRRQLGVSDARDPKAVVYALRKLYPTTAARLDDESKGQPIRVQATPEPALGMVTGTLDSPGQRRFRQERKALADDLDIAVNLASNRDFKEPVCGWRDSILAEVDEGEAAANLAVDPVSRDRAFYSVRKLGDCARVARLVGMINPAVSQEFGRLAASIDDNATLLRILAGEALFRAGFDKGGTVFQVALQDLRQRREALINSLEQLTATSIQEGYDDWGDGQASYGKLLEQLRARGQSDLRSIVRPDAMSRLLDVLLNNAPQQSGDLRGIASAVPVELIQLRRLRDVAGTLLDTSSTTTYSNQGTLLNPKVQGASAPLAAFTEALTLFIDAFDRPNAGARLLNLVLPVPLTFRDLTGKEQELSDKFRERNDTQEFIEDLLMDPSTSVDFWKELARLDRKLFHIDRIIDLFLLDFDEAPVPGGNLVDFHSEMLEQLDLKVDVFNVNPAFLREQCGLEEDSLELAKTLTQEAPGQAEEIEDDRNHKYGFPQGGHCNTGEPFTVPPPMRVSLDRIEKDLEARIINPGATAEHPRSAGPVEPPDATASATPEARAGGASMNDVASLIEKSRSRIMTDVKQQLEAQGPELARQLEQAFSDQLKAVERIIAGKERHGSDGQPVPANGYSKAGHTRRHVRHPRKP